MSEQLIEALPYFDRQERISWWDQKKLSEARILVVGAGALGNEVLKNLALLGVGHVLVIDFDTIEDSNLSRAVLFRTKDAVDGANKATIAANRAKALNPNPNAIVNAIHGDVVWELGGGIYRHVDLVLGCLDNLEARLSVNLSCWLTGKTWIDGAMWELSGSVAVYDASDEAACYECSMTPDHYRRAKVRYSCTNETVKTNLRKGFEPTTQTTSSIIAAIQVQETVKLLHGLPSFSGRRLVFNGAPHFYTDGEYSPMSMTELTHNPQCLCHGEEQYSNILELPDARVNETTARQLFAMVESETGWKNLTLELGRTFVVKATCSQCGWNVELCRPLYQVKDTDIVCPTCEVECPTCGFINVGKPDCANCGQVDISELRLEKFDMLSPSDPKMEPFLDIELAQLGIPPLHLALISDENNHYLTIEISGDLESLWE